MMGDRRHTRADDDTLTRAEHAYIWLRDRITSFDLRPGELLTEANLAQQLGMSRTPIREALRSLAADGLVLRAPQHGAVVAIVSLPEVLQAYEVRELLESYAARQAALRATENDVQELTELLGSEPEEKTTSVSRKEIVQLIQRDIDFHSKILSLSENEVLARVIDDMRTVTARVQFVIPRSRVRSYWYEHKSIVEAIKDGDPDKAEAQMRDHLKAAQGRIIQ